MSAGTNGPRRDDTDSSRDIDAMFAGPGEMRALCRTHDWAVTPLGAVEEWTPALRTMVAVVLSAPTAMILLWGPSLAQVYNDSYRELMRGKHPAGLGQPTRECWPEAWEFNAPIFDAVLSRGETFTFVDQRLELDRDGAPAEGYFTLAFSPVRGQSGAIDGVLATVFETTAQVRAASARELERERLLAASERARGDAEMAREALQRAAESLASSEAQYSALRTSLDAAFCVLEMIMDDQGVAVDYRILESNPAFTAHTGLVNPVGRTARELVPGVEKHWVDLYARVARTGEPVRTVNSSNAMGRWFDVFAFRVDGPDARRVGVLASDVTQQHQASLEHKRLHAALAIEQSRLAAVFQQSPSFLAVLRGPDNVFEMVNDAYEQVIGLGRDVVGKALFDALPETRAQGFGDLFAAIRATGTSRVFRELQVMLERVAGAPLEERYVDVTYMPLMEPDGSCDAIIAHGSDVTEPVRARRALEDAHAATVQSEMQLRVFADAIPTLAWTARADGYVDWYNAQWYAYTGCTRSEMEGWGWQSVHDPEVLPTVMQRWTHAITTGTEFEMTFPLRSADGTFQTFLTRAVPSRDADGRVVRWFGTNANIENEQRLRLAAEQANRAKSEFLAIMSHELRTPLNAIDGYAELMELGIRGPLTDEQRHDLARIRRSERHLLGLINGVLNYAQVESGSVNYDLEAISLHDVLLTCEALVAPQMLAKQLRFTCLPCEPSVMVYADREKMQQVMLNLLSNAIKFTDAGGSIELQWSNVERDDASVVQLVVTDTGIGMAAGQLARIFEPFVQVHSELTRMYQGTGLGLAISRDLARGMGGDITVSSALGRGSTFTVTLPGVPAITPAAVRQSA